MSQRALRQAARDRRLPAPGADDDVDDGVIQQQDEEYREEVMGNTTATTTSRRHKALPNTAPPVHEAAKRPRSPSSSPSKINDNAGDDHDAAPMMDRGHRTEGSTTDLPLSLSLSEQQEWILKRDEALEKSARMTTGLAEIVRSKLSDVVLVPQGAPPPLCSDTDITGSSGDAATEHSVATMEGASVTAVYPPYEGPANAIRRRGGQLNLWTDDSCRDFLVVQTIFHLWHFHDCACFITQQQNRHHAATPASNHRGSSRSVTRRIPLPDWCSRAETGVQKREGGGISRTPNEDEEDSSLNDLVSHVVAASSSSSSTDETNMARALVFGNVASVAISNWPRMYSSAYSSFVFRTLAGGDVVGGGKGGGKHSSSSTKTRKSDEQNMVEETTTFQARWNPYRAAVGACVDLGALHRLVAHLPPMPLAFTARDQSSLQQMLTEVLIKEYQLPMTDEQRQQQRYPLVADRTGLRGGGGEGIGQPTRFCGCCCACSSSSACTGASGARVDGRGLMGASTTMDESPRPSSSFITSSSSGMCAQQQQMARTCPAVLFFAATAGTYAAQSPASARFHHVEELEDLHRTHLHRHTHHDVSGCSRHDLHHSDHQLSASPHRVGGVANAACPVHNPALLAQVPPIAGGGSSARRSASAAHHSQTHNQRQEGTPTSGRMGAGVGGDNTPITAGGGERAGGKSDGSPSSCVVDGGGRYAGRMAAANPAVRALDFSAADNGDDDNTTATTTTTAAHEGTARQGEVEEMIAEATSNMEEEEGAEDLEDTAVPPPPAPPTFCCPGCLADVAAHFQSLLTRNVGLERMSVRDLHFMAWLLARGAAVTLTATATATASAPAGATAGAGGGATSSLPSPLTAVDAGLGGGAGGQQTPVTGTTPLRQGPPPLTATSAAGSTAAAADIAAFPFVLPPRSRDSLTAILKSLYYEVLRTETETNKSTTTATATAAAAAAETAATNTTKTPSTTVTADTSQRRTRTGKDGGSADGAADTADPQTVKVEKPNPTPGMVPVEDPAAEGDRRKLRRRELGGGSNGNIAPSASAAIADPAQRVKDEWLASGSSTITTPVAATATAAPAATAPGARRARPSAFQQVSASLRVALPDVPAPPPALWEAVRRCWSNHPYAARQGGEPSTSTDATPQHSNGLNQATVTAANAAPRRTSSTSFEVTHDPSEVSGTWTREGPDPLPSSHAAGSGVLDARVRRWAALQPLWCDAVRGQIDAAADPTRTFRYFDYTATASHPHEDPSQKDDASTTPPLPEGRRVVDINDFGRRSLAAFDAVMNSAFS